jgi:type II secretory pathway component PulF
MPTFVYDVIDTSGNNVKGRMEAESEGAVLSRLHEQRLHVLGISEHKTSALMSIGTKKSVGTPKLQSLVVFSSAWIFWSSRPKTCHSRRR